MGVTLDPFTGFLANEWRAGGPQDVAIRPWYQANALLEYDEFLRPCSVPAGEMPAYGKARGLIFGAQAAEPYSGPQDTIVPGPGGPNGPDPGWPGRPSPGEPGPGQPGRNPGDRTPRPRLGHPITHWWEQPLPPQPPKPGQLGRPITGPRSTGPVTGGSPGAPGGGTIPTITTPPSF